MKFFSKSFRRVSCWKNGASYEIYIEGFDEECKEELQIIIDFMKEISSQKSTFIETLGEMDIIHTNAIVYYEESPEHSNIYKMQIDLEKISVEDRLFVNIFTNFFIFDKTIEWKDFIYFIKMRKTNAYFKNGNLLALMNFTEFDGMQFKINENQCVHIEKMLERLKRKGFSIKMKYKICRW